MVVQQAKYPQSGPDEPLWLVASQPRKLNESIEFVEAPPLKCRSVDMVAYLAVAAVDVALLAIFFGWLLLLRPMWIARRAVRFDRLGRKHDALGRFTK